MHKFERLEVWELSIEYVDLCYSISEQLPKREEFNLASQLRRAATSVALNIAEGSTGQSDAEQARFLGMALRSLIETVACQHLIFRRQYGADVALLRQAYKASDKLAAKIQAMRKTLVAQPHIGEAPEEYQIDSGTPFDEPDHTV